MRNEPGVRVLTLTRAAGGNALDVDVARKLRATLAAWERNALIGGVVLRGAGGCFSVGLDTLALREAGSAPLQPATAQPDSASAALAHAQLDEAFRLYHLLGTYRKPLVAFVDGIVTGGGIALAPHNALGAGGSEAATRFSVATEATAFVAAPHALRGAGGFGELGVADGGVSHALLQRARIVATSVPRARRSGGKRGDGGATAADAAGGDSALAPRDASDARALARCIALSGVCLRHEELVRLGICSHAVRQASVDYLEHAICAAVSGELDEAALALSTPARGTRGGAERRDDRATAPPASAAALRAPRPAVARAVAGPVREWLESASEAHITGDDALLVDDDLLATHGAGRVIEGFVQPPERLANVVELARRCFSSAHVRDHLAALRREVATADADAAAEAMRLADDAQAPLDARGRALSDRGGDGTLAGTARAERAARAATAREATIGALAREALVNMRSGSSLSDVCHPI